MSTQKASSKYVAFLRGINVGGHHKVPMAELRAVLEEVGFENVITLLNSGNVIFDSTNDKPEGLEKMITERLETTFGFPIPTLIRRAGTIQDLYISAPFKAVNMHKDIRLYISFLKAEHATKLALPWLSDDKSYQIIQEKDRAILSILDLSISQTPKAMEIMEKTYGKDITTRNWKTIERIVGKL